jgi:DNA invertase Pin-like site-specific DNA recombinase
VTVPSLSNGCTAPFKERRGELLAAVAKQERVRLSKRTIAGQQSAKASGTCLARPRTDPRTMANLVAPRRSGVSIRRIAGELDLSPTTVARLLREHVAPGH